LLAIPIEPGPPRLVLIGYSKGAPDILEALVTYPEIRSRVAAMWSWRFLARSVRRERRISATGMSAVSNSHSAI